MLRKKFIIIPIIMLALTGCGTKSKNSAESGVQGPSVGAAAPATPAAPAAPEATATPFACPTTATRKLAKTRFITNAGLAAGAFKRYIYSPYQKGTFRSGAHGRKRAIVKAAAAGVFTLDQLRRAKANVQADPGLCKVLAAPLSHLSAAATALAARLKRGDADPASIGATSGALEQTRGAAGGAGAGFKDKNVPANMIGG